jgi:hypothetical protein
MMKTGLLLISILVIFGICFPPSYADDVENPAILKGKIWSGSDTLDLGKKELPDPLESQEAKEEDFFAGDITQLPVRAVSAKTEILQLKLSIPRDLKFLAEAPVVLKAKSSKQDVIKIGEGIGNDPQKGFIFPITVNPGKADIYLFYRVVCCTTEDRKACFFKEARLKIPVEVGDFEETVIKVRHDIED